MIFLIIQTIKENINHNGFVEIIASSSVLGYLFFRKIKRFKKLDKASATKLYFILSLVFFCLAVLLSSFAAIKFLIGITALLGFYMLIMSAIMLMACEPMKNRKQ